jgi:hypothetical protein
MNLALLKIAPLPTSQQVELARSAMIVQHRFTGKVEKIAMIQHGGEVDWVAKNESYFPKRTHRIIIALMTVVGELLDITVEDTASAMPTPGRA